MTHAWITTLSEAMWHNHYGDAVRTWLDLPGRKIVLFDGTLPQYGDLEFRDYWQCIDAANTQWFTTPQGKKARRLSYKAWALWWAVKNIDVDVVVFIDADITVHRPVPAELLDIGDNLWSTLSFAHSSNPAWTEFGQQVESGLQIINRRHPQAQEFIDTYIDFYESGLVHSLYRPYDNWVSRAMLDLYPMINLVTQPDVKRAVGEDTMQFTRFASYLTHFLGKHNKANIPAQETA
jgi:hypothetical protein